MYTTFKRSDLLYKDYKWEAVADYDNPKVIGGNDHKQLNRTEGYEMLYFIKSLALTWGWKGQPNNVGQRLESIIREKVPSFIRTHSGIRDWISQNYKQV